MIGTADCIEASSAKMLARLVSTTYSSENILKSSVERVRRRRGRAPAVVERRHGAVEQRLWHESSATVACTHSASWAPLRPAQALFHRRFACNHRLHRETVIDDGIIQHIDI